MWITSPARPASLRVIDHDPAGMASGSGLRRKARKIEQIISFGIGIALGTGIGIGIRLEGFLPFIDRDTYADGP